MENRPRILFIVPLEAPVHGSTIMCEHIRQSVLINENFHCDYVNLSTSRSMKEIGSFRLIKLFRFLRSWFKTAFLLATVNYDACYIALSCHGKGFLKDAAFAVLCKLFGKKLIIHQHNKGMSSCIRRNPYKWLIPYVYKNACVILLSWRLYADIEPAVSKDQVYICPNGIPESVNSAPHRSNDIPHLLFLSNMIASKGVWDLLEASLILKAQGIDFICDYVGSETSEITKEGFNNRIHSMGLDGTVVYHGPKYGDEKNSFWSSSDIFVFPSYFSNEAFSLVLLEAMQHSIPVVSYAEGGIPDIVEDNVTGFICEKRNINQLAVLLKTLIEDPERAVRMGQEGQKRFKEKFTLDIWEKSLTDILKSAII